MKTVNDNEKTASRSRGLTPFTENLGVPKIIGF